MSQKYQSEFTFSNYFFALSLMFMSAKRYHMGDGFAVYNYKSLIKMHMIVMLNVFFLFVCFFFFLVSRNFFISSLFFWCCLCLLEKLSFALWCMLNLIACVTERKWFENIKGTCGGFRACKEMLMIFLSPMHSYLRSGQQQSAPQNKTFLSKM